MKENGTMQLVDIQPAIQLIENRPLVTDIRARTYMSTYPAIISLAGQGQINTEMFNQLCLMVYGWMPRILRIDSEYLTAAVDAANSAKEATSEERCSVDIDSIASCLHSVVGASKLIHFLNPNVFPIWDSKIQAFRGLPNGYNHMAKTTSYLEYLDCVHEIINDGEFDEFYQRYSTAYSNRLQHNNIHEYQITRVRAVEVSAFELSP